MSNEMIRDPYDWMLTPLFRPANPACAGEARTMAGPTAHHVREARRICSICPDYTECVKHILGSPMDWAGPGVWAGTTQKERRRMGPKEKQQLLETSDETIVAV